jgi:D-alanyl-D-alanine dipeptidase
MTDFTAERIPSLGDTEPYRKTAFREESFVELCDAAADSAHGAAERGVLCSPKISVQMQYPLLHMQYAENRCFLRKETADRLLAAASLLPDGIRFRIWDAWRPFALQQELFEVYTDRIVRVFHLEGKTPEERRMFMSRFVALPNADSICPPVHTTGGALDVTLENADETLLPMGTGFDSFSDATWGDWFERLCEGSVSMEEGLAAGTVLPSEFRKEDAEKIRDNRRLLYHVMTSAGFTGIGSEWWHFDFGDRNWAFYTGGAALYQGVFTAEDIRCIR